MPLLASAVLEQLNLQLPLSIEVLTSLAYSKTLRNTFLQHDSRLLDELLRRSDGNDQRAQQSSQACVAFLSFPLPNAIPLPATVAPFFVGLFDKMLRNLSNETAWRVFLILDGVGPSLLDLLDTKKISRFAENVYGLLKKVKMKVSQDALSPTLMAILGTIHHWHTRSLPSLPESSVLVESSHRASPLSDSRVHDVFHGHFAKSTTHLALAYASFACKQDMCLTLEEAWRLAYLPANFFPEINLEIVKEVIEHNPFLETKLLEKITGEGLAPAIRVQGITVAIGVSRAVGRILPALLEACKSVLLEAFEDGHATESQNQSFRAALTVILASSDAVQLDLFISQMLEKFLNLPVHTLAARERLNMLISVFEAELHQACLRRAIIHAIKKQDVTARTMRVLSSHRAGLVPLLAHRNNAIQSALISLLLNVAIRSQGEDVSMPADLSLSLLQRLKELAMPAKSSSLTGGEHRSSTNELRSQSNKPLDSRRWQHYVGAELDNHACESRQNIIDMFGRACQDMDRRCKDAERPWQEEKVRHEETHKALVATQSRVKELEEHEELYRSRTQSLEFENRGLVEHVARIEAEIQEAQETNTRLDTQLQEARALTETTAQEAKQAHARLVSEHQAAEGSFKEQLDELHEQLETYRQRIDVLESHGTESKRLLSERDGRIASSVATEQQLNNEIGELNAQIAKFSDSLREAHLALESYRTEAGQDIDRIKDDSERILKKVKAEAINIEQQLQAEIDARSVELEEQTLLHSAEIAAKSTSIKELERRIKSLDKEVRLKEAENNKLQHKWKSMQQNMQNLFSTAEEQQAPDPMSQPAEAFEDELTDNVEFDEPHHAQLEEDFNTSFGSSSSKCEPTPKRQKPRPTFKPPLPRAQHTAPSALSPAKQRATREPLQETAANRPSRKSLPAGHEKLVMISPPKPSARLRARKSIAAPVSGHATNRPMAASREKENAYISRDDLPFSTMRTDDFDATTDEF